MAALRLATLKREMETLSRKLVEETELLEKRVDKQKQDQDDTQAALDKSRAALLAEHSARRPSLRRPERH